MFARLAKIFERSKIEGNRENTESTESENSDVEDSTNHSASVNTDKVTSIKISPDSKETASQTALSARKIREFPFIFGRRGNLAGVGLFTSNQFLVADRHPYSVSRNHCVIESDDSGFYVRDNESRLGSIVNGIGVGGPHDEESIRLNHGENTLILGHPDSEIRFKIIV